MRPSKLAPFLAFALATLGCNSAASLRFTYHEVATREGFRDTGLEKIAFEAQNEVIGVDFAETELLTAHTKPNDKYRAKHHCDRAPAQSSAEALLAMLDYRESQRAAFKEAMAGRDRKEALEALARLLHATQDFYSHSNYVDLDLETRKAIDRCFHEGSREVPEALLITGYDPKAKVPGLPPGDRYPHDDKAKDFEKGNLECELTLRDGRSKYDHALEAAILCTRETIRRLDQELRREIDAKQARAAWKMLSRG